MAADGPRWRRALALTALGTLVPGARLTQARSRWLGRLGWLMVAATLVVLGTVAYAVWTRGFSSAVLDVVSRPEALRPAAFVGEPQAEDRCPEAGDVVGHGVERDPGDALGGLYPPRAQHRDAQHDVAGWRRHRRDEVGGQVVGHGPAQPQ